MDLVRPRSIRTCALFLLLSSAVANATTVEIEMVDCPLGEGSVKVYHLSSTSQRGGYDSDLASYASQGQFRTYAVSTCPENMFSLRGTDMAVDLGPVDQEKLEAVIDEETQRLADAENPTVWERYRIAARIYEFLGHSQLTLANLYLEASWTARDEAVGVYLGLNGPKDAASLLAGGDQELQKELSTEQRKVVLWNLARVAHRAGENTKRDGYVQEFRSLGALTDAETQAVQVLNNVAHEIEPALQRLALAAFKKALEEELSPTERARAKYLEAELNRRLGNADVAAPLFVAVRDDTQTENSMRDMASLFADQLRH